MTLTQYIDMTHSYTTKNFWIYEEGSSDEVWARINGVDGQKELPLDELDTSLICALVNVQPMTAITFLKREIAMAKVVNQHITTDRIYVIVRMVEDE